MAERRNIGEIYWYLSFEKPDTNGKHGKYKALSAREKGDAFDNCNWENENYYTDLDKAKKEMTILNDELAEQEKKTKAQQGMPTRKVESEKDVERYLVNQAIHRGWLPLKYSSGFTTGYPDRCILLPGGHTVWVEVKTTGQKPTKLQKIRLQQLEQMGFSTWVADSRKAVDEMITTLEGALDGIRKEMLRP